MWQRNVVIIVAAPVLTIAVLASVILIMAHSDNRDGNLFAHIQLGDTEHSVVERMGPPDRTEKCGKWLYWGGDGDYRGENDGRCVRMVRYDHFLSSWGVGYSADGRVVSKYHYVSE